MASAQTRDASADKSRPVVDNAVAFPPLLSALPQHSTEGTLVTLATRLVTSSERLVPRGSSHGAGLLFKSETTARTATLETEICGRRLWGLPQRIVSQKAPGQTGETGCARIAFGNVGPFRTLGNHVS
jgi:hypothetical protein